MDLRRGGSGWRPLEAALFELATRHIQLFAAAHPDETFCSFAFDCNSPYGDVLTCFDAEADCRERHRRAKAGEPFDEGPWETGAWPYRSDHFCPEPHGRIHYCQEGAPDCDAYAQAWGPFERAVRAAFDAAPHENDDDDDDDDNGIMDDFMDAVTRVLVRLERTGAFDCLTVTPDFRILAIDHDEPEDEALERLVLIRASRN